jgi:hypothetical protein
MAVVIAGGERQGNDTWQAMQTLTQSTASDSSFQSIDMRKEVSVLGMGTATGHFRNRYSLATTGVEGQTKLVISSATGEAKVFVPTRSGRMSVQASLLAVPSATAVDAVWASATGLWQFTADGNFLLLRFFNGLWHVQDGAGVTMTTGT